MSSDAEIEALVCAFEGGTLPKAEWTHQVHLKISIAVIRNYPRGEATFRVKDRIKAHNARHGNTTGYHETITLAWVDVVARFLAEHDHGQPLSLLADRLIETCGDKNHLLVYYTAGILKSEVARRTLVPPDVRAFEPAVIEAVGEDSCK